MNILGFNNDMLTPWENDVIPSFKLYFPKSNLLLLIIDFTPRYIRKIIDINFIPLKTSKLVLIIKAIPRTANRAYMPIPNPWPKDVKIP